MAPYFSEPGLTRIVGARVCGSQTSWKRSSRPQPVHALSAFNSLRRTTMISPHEQGTAWAPAGISGGGLGLAEEDGRDARVTAPVRLFFPGANNSAGTALGAGRAGLAVGVAEREGLEATIVRIRSPRCTIGFWGTMIADFCPDPPSILKTT
jgi:hypothetical protein